MNMTTINQMQYTGALPITNRKAPKKAGTNKKPQNRPPTWQQQLKRQIDLLYCDISIISE